MYDIALVSPISLDIFNNVALHYIEYAFTKPLHFLSHL